MWSLSEVQQQGTEQNGVCQKPGGGVTKLPYV